MAISARAAAVAGFVAPVSARLVAVDGLAVTVSYTVFVRVGALGVALDAVPTRAAREDAALARAVVVAAGDQRSVMPDAATARAVDPDASTARTITADNTPARAVEADSDTPRTIEGLPMEIYRGDSGPDFGATITDGGSPVDLTGASAVLRMAFGGTTIEKTLAIDAPATDGHVSYDWSTAETSELSAGRHACCIVVTFADSTVLTWPSKGQTPVSIEVLNRQA